VRIYQSYNVGDDGDYDGFTANWYAQTFTPVAVHIIAKVKLKLFRVGDAGTITVSIKNTAGGKPVGADLCSGTIEATDITLDAGGEWYEITLGDGYVAGANTQLAIVVRAPNGDASNKVSWRADVGSSTYAGGTVCSSTDSGIDWGTISGSDFMFEEWGVGEGSTTTIVWGNLVKSQISAEKVEEAIARIIAEHELDPNAHVDEGESLYSHKASEIIDHIAQSIITDKLKDLSVSTAKIINEEIEEAKIGSLAVTETKIGNEAVAEGKIKALAVTTAKIKNLAVTEAKINSLAVTEAKIGSLAVTVAKIGNLAVTEAKIGTLAVTEAKIGSLAVTGAKIANATIGDAKITDLTVEKLTGTYITGKTIRTAVSGQRVEIRGANNDIAFYDADGNLGGTIKGSGNKIYVSGAGIEIECPLSMEDELIMDTTRHVIPTTTIIYDLGTSSLYWRDLFLKNLKFNSSYGKIYHGATEILDFSSDKLECKKPFGFEVRAGTPGNASDFTGHMYYDTDETDLVFSNGSDWYKVSATII